MCEPDHFINPSDLKAGEELNDQITPDMQIALNAYVGEDDVDLSKENEELLKSLEAANAAGECERSTAMMHLMPDHLDVDSNDSDSQTHLVGCICMHI